MNTSSNPPPPENPNLTPKNPNPIAGGGAAVSPLQNSAGGIDGSAKAKSTPNIQQNPKVDTEIKIATEDNPPPKVDIPPHFRQRTTLGNLFRDEAKKNKSYEVGSSSRAPFGVVDKSGVDDDLEGQLDEAPAEPDWFGLLAKSTWFVLSLALIILDLVGLFLPRVLIKWLTIALSIIVLCSRLTIVLECGYKRVFKKFNTPLLNQQLFRIAVALISVFVLAARGDTILIKDDTMSKRALTCYLLGAEFFDLVVHGYLVIHHAYNYYYHLKDRNGKEKEVEMKFVVTTKEKKVEAKEKAAAATKKKKAAKAAMAKAKKALKVLRAAAAKEKRAAEVQKEEEAVASSLKEEEKVVGLDKGKKHMV